MADLIEITSVNQRIRHIRKTLSLSQVKFAKIISISNGYLADIELNKNKVNDRIIKLVCTSFNVNERWLRCGEGEIFTENPNAQFTQLLGLYKELAPKYQDYILKQINQLLAIQEQDEA